MDLSVSYRVRIQNRSYWRFFLGLIPRFISKIKYDRNVSIARRRGATIGNNVTIIRSLAKKANSNLTIGDNCSIQTDLIDLRSKVEIGNNVIIGSGVEIITTSHYIDSVEWEHKYYGLKIEDYVWLATRSFILPSCRLIKKGAVCAAGSVLFKNVENMSIVSGNPATQIRIRKNIHSNLVIESLLGNDFSVYIKTYFNKS